MNREKINRYLGLLLIIVSVCVIALSTDNFAMADIHFYLLVSIAVLDLLFNKSFSLLTVWIAGFIFVILSEMILITDVIAYTWVNKFVLFANDAVLAGYYLTKSKKRNIENTHNEYQGAHSSFVFVLYLVYFIYLYYLTPTAIQAFLVGGRNVDEIMNENILFSTFLGGYHILPLVIAFYYIRIRHERIIKAFLISLPIFIIEFLSGTRFKMLFTLLPFFLVSGILRIDKIKLKNLVSLLLIVVLIISGADYMRHTRRSGFGNYRESDKKEILINPHGNSISVKVCEQCSPEGTIKMMNILHYHLENNEHTYGLSMGFIFYFWIPRVVWPSKPTMLNHWLPRKYLNVAEGFSSSTGFMGEPYADFGYFAFIIYFIMGVLLRKGNNLLIKYDYGRANVYTSLYVSLLIPSTFFIVRSPVTGTCYMIMQWLMLYLFSKFFIKK